MVRVVVPYVMVVQGVDAAGVSAGTLPVTPPVGYSGAGVVPGTATVVLTSPDGTSGAGVVPGAIGVLISPAGVLTPPAGAVGDAGVGLRGMYDGQSVTSPGFSEMCSAQIPMRYWRASRVSSSVPHQAETQSMTCLVKSLFLQ